LLQADQPIKSQYQIKSFKEYSKFLNRLYDITWLGCSLRLINREAFMKSVNCSKLTCSNISNITYNLIFRKKIDDSSILIRLFHVTIWICRWRMNMLVTSQYQTRLSSITKIFSRRISQSDCSIQIINEINEAFEMFPCKKLDGIYCFKLPAVKAWNHNLIKSFVRLFVWLLGKYESRPWAALLLWVGWRVNIFLVN
jgi:hypothetical protein